MPASPPRRPIPPIMIGVRQVDIERGRGVGQGRLAPAAEVDVRSVDADVAEGAEIVALHVQVGLRLVVDVPIALQERDGVAVVERGGVRAKSWT